MSWEFNYKPEPVGIKDIIDAEVSLSFSNDCIEANGKAVAQFVEEITDLIKNISKSGQTLLLPEDLCPHGNFDRHEIGRFIRERINLRLEANYLQSPEVQSGVYDATILRVYREYNSIKLEITDPRYNSGRMVYLDDFSGVEAALGATPKSGQIIKVKNIRFMNSVKTPSNHGTKTWTNQRVADLAN